MQNCKISLIVPFFNTPYELFSNCLESLLCQTFREYEIIVIDDGSKKYFAQFIDSKCSNLKNVRVFHINNNGVSYARNYGLSKAMGNYVCFVDSDDYLASWALEDLYMGICRYKADICISYIKKVETTSYSFKRSTSYQIIDMYEEKQKNYINEIIMRGLNIVENEKGFLSCGPCAILLKAEVAIRYDFPLKIKYMEDVIWNYEVFNSAHIIVKLNETTYAYMHNELSATRRYERTIMNERIHSLLKIKELVGENQEIEQWFGLRLLCNLSIICYQCGHIDSVKNIKPAIREAYDYSYRKDWSILKKYKIDRKWEIKYRFKLWLYRIKVLPLLLVVRQIINELRLNCENKN